MTRAKFAESRFASLDIERGDAGNLVEPARTERGAYRGLDLIHRGMKLAADADAKMFHRNPSRPGACFPFNRTCNRACERMCRPPTRPYDSTGMCRSRPGLSLTRRARQPKLASTLV